MSSVPKGIGLARDASRLACLPRLPVSTSFIHLGLEWFGDRAGGLEKYHHEICVTHTKMGVEVTAWLQKTAATPIGVTDYRVVAYASPADSRAVKRDRLRSLARVELAHSDAVMVTHHASVSDVLLPLLKGRPHVVHFQGPWSSESALDGAPRWKTFLQRRQESRVYRSADRIVTLSAAFRDLVVERYGVDADRVHVIPGAINAAAADPRISRVEARERLGWPTDRPIVLSVRRLCRRVGVDVLVQAARDVVQKLPDALLLIGGTGPLRAELEALIERHRLGEHVRLLGFVPDADLPIAYRAADYSIVPTQALEGFGLVTLESMATGTPAIVTPVGSLPEVIGPLSDSLVLAGRSSQQISEGLISILRGERSIPSEADCRRYVQSNYDWSVIAPRVLNIYRAV